jgi:hypothetical protein
VKLDGPGSKRATRSTNVRTKEVKTLRFLGVPMRHHITKQVHEKFKVFSGELSADGTIGKLADEIAAFAKRAKAAPKSIGVAHLEPTKRLVITLGYREDELPYPIGLKCIPLGKVDVEGHDFSALEAVMVKATRKHRNIICHELYLTGPNELMMVVMTHKAK